MFLRLIHKGFRGLAVIGMLLVLVTPTLVAATPYGGGDYGDCKYNNGCPASTSTDSTTGTGTSEPAAPGETLLNDFTEYTDGDGKQLELTEDQKVVFDVTNDGKTTRYTAIIKEIAEDSVVITIGDQEITLQIGETQQIDVDGDGVNDIEITLVSIDGGKANLKFKALVLGANTTNTPTTPTNTQSKEESEGFNWLVPLSILLIALGILWFIVLAKRRKHDKTPTGTV